MKISVQVVTIQSRETDRMREKGQRKRLEAISLNMDYLQLDILCARVKGETYFRKSTTQ